MTTFILNYMRELIDKIKILQDRIAATQRLIDFNKIDKEIAVIEKEMTSPHFWDDPIRAPKRSQLLEELKEEKVNWQEIKKNTQELLEMAQLADKEAEKKLLPEIQGKFKQLTNQFKQLELKLLLNGPYDKENAVLTIHAGAGGIDAQDWAEMLERMYLRYCEQRGWLTKILERSVGQEAGIKKVCLEISGRYAYGYLRAEAGVHRLVRISPFDAEKMRHTSFALVDVLPELIEIKEVVIKPEDLRIDVFRASGHGGQSVNTTDSAVRIVHLPTGLTATCQNERSQLQNKETALKILKSKLYQYYQTEQEEERQRLRGEFKEAAWGNQIRSYIFHPYKMVKDHRTGYQVSELDKVLDGEIGGFIEAYLRHQASQ